jgi:hypothetical protein
MARYLVTVGAELSSIWSNRTEGPTFTQSFCSLQGWSWDHREGIPGAHLDTTPGPYILGFPPNPMLSRSTGLFSGYTQKNREALGPRFPFRLHSPGVKQLHPKLSGTWQPEMEEQNQASRSCVWMRLSPHHPLLWSQAPGHSHNLQATSFRELNQLWVSYSPSSNRHPAGIFP